MICDCPVFLFLLINLERKRQTLFSQTMNALEKTKNLTLPIISFMNCFLIISNSNFKSLHFLLSNYTKAKEGETE